MTQLHRGPFGTFYKAADAEGREVAINEFGAESLLIGDAAARQARLEMEEVTPSPSQCAT